MLFRSQRPTLATEYQLGETWDYHKRRKVVLEMHSNLFAHYESVLHGETQLLQKMHSFWEYQEPEMEKRIYKKIIKSGNLKNYKLAVDMV